MTDLDRLERLHQLRQDGALTEEEFQREKAKALAGAAPSAHAGAPTGPDDTVPPRPWGMDRRSFLLLMHLSQFAGAAVPGAGIALPIVMWATNKEDEDIDAHGRIIINWIISVVIYGVIGALLFFLVVGIPLLIALGICALVFPIIGAVKANDGQTWRYPLSIRFL